MNLLFLTLNVVSGHTIGNFNAKGEVIEGCISIFRANDDFGKNRPELHTKSATVLINFTGPVPATMSPMPVEWCLFPAGLCPVISRISRSMYRCPGDVHSWIKE